jgi:hypothetical protein
MIHAKPWEGGLAEIEERRQRPRTARLEPKGRPPQRACPIDFDVIFVEIGRLDCENWYRASRITVNRWLDERGKARLINLRAAFVRHQRDAERPVRKPRILLNPNEDRRFLAAPLAKLAADYLRIIRNGGWRISLTPEGDWWVGSARRTSAEMLEMAVARGFDVERANLQLKAQQTVGERS